MKRFVLALSLLLPGCSSQSFLDPWQLAMKAPPRVRSTPESVVLGQQVFLNSSCVMCHSIRGTRARASVGPDLTHIASRRTLAAGSFPNTRGHLAGWILNPQHIKPGTHMPPTPMNSSDLHALLAFLESLE